MMCPDEGYFLWVAAFDWGWKEKGIHIFLEMAKARPAYKFVAYGAARTPTVWTEKAVVDMLSAKLRPTATVTKAQGAAIRTYVGTALAEAEITALLAELKTTKGPRNIARCIATYDGHVIGLIIAAITE